MKMLTNISDLSFSMQCIAIIMKVMMIYFIQSYELDVCLMRVNFLVIFSPRYRLFNNSSSEFAQLYVLTTAIFC